MARDKPVTSPACKDVAGGEVVADEGGVAGHYDLKQDR